MRKVWKRVARGSEKQPVMIRTVIITARNQPGALECIEQTEPGESEKLPLV